jgi:hypothetical protein
MQALKILHNKSKITPVYFRLAIAVLGMGGLFMPSSVMADLETYPFEITGVLTAVNTTPISANPNAIPPVLAALGTITVNGLVIPVAAQDGLDPPKIVRSPTKAGLTLAQLSATPVLPGRSQNGFLRGTVTAAGKMTIDTDTVDGYKVKLMIVNNIQVDPGAEYAVLGTVTDAVCTNMACSAVGDYIKMGTKFPGAFPLSLNTLGMEIKALADTRIPGAVINHGFKTNLTGTGSNANGNIISASVFAQGYYAPIPVTAASKFYYWNADIDAVPLLNPATAETSITSAKARWLNKSDQCKYDVSGFVHNWQSIATSVTLWRADSAGNKVTGAAAIGNFAITDLGTYGKWDASVTTTPSSTPPNTLSGTRGCPVQILAEITGNAATKVILPLTLRIDPLFDQYAP